MSFSEPNCIFLFNPDALFCLHTLNHYWTISRHKHHHYQNYVKQGQANTNTHVHSSSSSSLLHLILPCWHGLDESFLLLDRSDDHNLLHMFHFFFHFHFSLDFYGWMPLQVHKVLQYSFQLSITQGIGQHEFGVENTCSKCHATILLSALIIHLNFKFCQDKLCIPSF